MIVYQQLDEIALPGSTQEDREMIEHITGCELICKNGIWYVVQPVAEGP